MSLRSPTNSLRSPLKRPKVSFNLDEEMALSKENDPLPIVELKPFVHKVWRREKSLPSFYEKFETSSVNTRSNTTSRNDTVSEVSGSQGDTTPPPPPPRTSQSLPATLPSQRLVHLYVNTFNDFKSQKEHLNNFVGESGFRPKSRLHPHVDCKNRKQPEHSINLIQGFITRDDRTNTTLTEISEGDSINRTFSCSPKAVKPADVKRQQQMRVKGEPLNYVANSNKTNLGCITPVKSPVTMSSPHGTGIRHGSPASILYYNRSVTNHRMKRTKTPLYDHIDRRGALPSLTVNAKSLKDRNAHRIDDCNSEDYSDYRDTYDSNMKHKVGGIENSFKVLSKHGTPTKVERQISFELELNLSRFRKSKDYSPFEINPSELAKYYPQPSFNMTQGEALIRQGLQSNTSKRRRTFTRANGTVYTRPVKPLRSGLDTPFAQGILKKKFAEMEHIDSYHQHLFEYNNNEFERERSITTDEELVVPNDTPRSQIDSRISIKPVEMVLQERGVGTHDRNKDDDKATEGETLNGEGDGKMEITPTSTTKQREDNQQSESDGKQIDNNVTESKMSNESKSIAKTRVDPNGRTFITSDSIPPYAVNV